MMNSSRTVFFTVVWMSTKCFHVRHLMSLIAMLIEEIRYFDKKQTKLPLIDNSKSRLRIMLLSQFTVFSPIAIALCGLSRSGLASALQLGGFCRLPQRKDKRKLY